MFHKMLLLIGALSVLIKWHFCQLIDESLNVTGEAYVAELTKLETDLLKNYSRYIRPVKAPTFKTSVYFFTVIHHIQELDEKEGKITVRGAIYMEWEDYFIRWNREDYSNVSRIILPAYLVWRPNLLVYNAAENINESTFAVWNSHVWFYPSGRAIWYPQFSFVASCNLDFEGFPYDVHECPIAVGPWSYNRDELEFVVVADKPVAWMTYNDTKSVVSGWQLKDIKQRRGWWDALNHTFYFTEPPANSDAFYFPIVEITPVLKRHIPYFSIAAILPSVAFSILTALSFVIIDLKNRAFVLVVNLVLQIIFADDLLRILPPTTDNIPDIVYYFAWNLILTLIAIVLFIIMESLKFSEMKASAIPNLLTVLTNFWISLKIKFHCRNVEKEIVVHDQDENVEVASSSTPRSKVFPLSRSWNDVVETLSELSFIMYFIIYLILIFIYLN